ncbi:MAG: SIS domain-containing protein [Armatimonadota bacterium]|nr:SIS domain-containing protein [Armatimonadota bacterium]
MSAGLPDDQVLTPHVRAHLETSAVVTRASLETVAPRVAVAARLILDAVRAGGKVVPCGNGGSAADAQHLAAELLGRFARERALIPAIVLTVDGAVLTALGNDYGFDRAFARQLEGLVRPGDVVVIISTTGRSRNVVGAAAPARRAGARVVALTGRNGGDLAHLADVEVRVPSDRTSHVQEVHITIGHAICAILEDAWQP